MFVCWYDYVISFVVFRHYLSLNVNTVYCNTSAPAKNMKFMPEDISSTVLYGNTCQVKITGIDLDDWGYL